MTTKQNPKGDSILELIVVTAIIAIGLIAVLSLSNRSQRSSDYSKSSSVATNYAYQTRDWLHNLKSTLGWENLLYYLTQDSGGNSLTYCLNSTLPTDESSFASLTAGTDCELATIPSTLFSRQITFDLSEQGNDKLTGTITLTWPEQTTRTNNLEFELSKW